MEETKEEAMSVQQVMDERNRLLILGLWEKLPYAEKLLVLYYGLYDPKK